MKIMRDGITLREIEPGDTEQIVKWRNKDWVRSNFVYQSLFTRESHENWYQNKILTGLVKQFIILVKTTDYEEVLPVGSVYLRDIDEHHHRAEFGIFIGEETALKSGIGTKAAKLITQYGFNELGLHKIYLRVFEDNARAIKCYEKAGFKQEARFQDDVLIQGKYRSMIIMSMINPQYSKKDCE